MSDDIPQVSSDYIKSAAMVEGFNPDMFDRTVIVPLSVIELGVLCAFIEMINQNLPVARQMQPVVDEMHAKFMSAIKSTAEPGDTPNS